MSKKEPAENKGHFLKSLFVMAPILCLMAVKEVCGKCGIGTAGTDKAINRLGIWATGIDWEQQEKERAAALAELNAPKNSIAATQNIFAIHLGLSQLRLLKDELQDFFYSPEKRARTQEDIEKISENIVSRYTKAKEFYGGVPSFFSNNKNRIADEFDLRAEQDVTKTIENRGKVIDIALKGLMNDEQGRLMQEKEADLLKNDSAKIARDAVIRNDIIGFRNN